MQAGVQMGKQFSACKNIYCHSKFKRLLKHVLQVKTLVWIKDNSSIGNLVNLEEKAVYRGAAVGWIRSMGLVCGANQTHTLAPGTGASAQGCSGMGFSCNAHTGPALCTVPTPFQGLHLKPASVTWGTYAGPTLHVGSAAWGKYVVLIWTSPRAGAQIWSGPAGCWMQQVPGTRPLVLRTAHTLSDSAPITECTMCQTNSMCCMQHTKWGLVYAACGTWSQYDPLGQIVDPAPWPGSDLWPVSLTILA